MTSDRSDPFLAEIHFIIAKFLEQGPFQDLAQEFIARATSSHALPSTVNWKGDQRALTWQQLNQRYAHIEPDHLVRIFKDWIALYATRALTQNALVSTHYLHSLIEKSGPLDHLLLLDSIRKKSASKWQPCPRSLRSMLVERETGMLPFRENMLPKVLPLFAAQYEELASVQGHTQPVYCLCFDKTENRFITGGDDGLVKVWCLKSARLIYSLRGHTNCVSDFSLSPDNTKLASGSLDGTIRIWDLKTGSPSSVLQHGSGVYTVEFHPFFSEGQPLLLSTGNDGLARIWRLTDIKPALMTFYCKSVGRDQIRCAAFSLGGTKFFVGGTDGLLRAYKVPDLKSPEFVEIDNENRPMSTRPPHSGPIGRNAGSGLHRSSLETAVVTAATVASSPIDVESVDVEMNSTTGTFPLREPASSDVEATSWLPVTPATNRVNENVIASAQALRSGPTVSRGRGPSHLARSSQRARTDRNNELYLVKYFDDHRGYVTTLACSTLGKFVSGSWDGTARIRSLNEATGDWHSVTLDTLATNFSAQHQKVTMVLWTFGDTYILTASTDNHIRVWEPTTGVLLRTLIGHIDDIYILVGHPEVETILLSAGFDGRAFLWDITSGKQLFSYDYIGRRFMDGQFSPKGTYFALTDDLGKCSLFGLGISRDLYMKSAAEQFFPGDFRRLIVDAQSNVVDELTLLQPYLEPRTPTMDSSAIPNPLTYPVDYGLLFDWKIDPAQYASEMEELKGILATEKQILKIEETITKSNTFKSLPKKRNQTKSKEPFYGSDGEEEAEMMQYLMMQEDSSDELYEEEEEEEEQSRRRRRGSGRRAMHSSASSEEESASESGLSDELVEEDFIADESQVIEHYTRSGRPVRSLIGTRARRASPIRRSSRRRGHTASFVTDSEASLGGGRSDLEEQEGRTRNRNRNRARVRSRIQSESEFELNSELKEETHSESDHLIDVEDNSTDEEEDAWQEDERQQVKSKMKMKKKDANSKSKSKSNKKNEQELTGVDTHDWNDYLPFHWASSTNRWRIPYLPQIGDQVAYFRQGHEAFLNSLDPIQAEQSHFFQGLPWQDEPSWPPVVSGRILSVDYRVGPPMWVELTLERLDDLNSGSSSGSSSQAQAQLTHSNAKFKSKSNAHLMTIRYYDTGNSSEFVILWSLYEWGLAQSWPLGSSIQVIFDAGEKYEAIIIAEKRDEDPRYPGSPWQPYRIRWISEADASVASCSAWEIEAAPSGARFEDPEELPGWLRARLAQKWPSAYFSEPWAEPFLEPVDWEQFPAYPMVVPYPMHLGLIIERLTHNYYRRPQALLWDIELIAKNAMIFNEPDSQVVHFSQQLVVTLSDAFQEMLQRPMPRGRREEKRKVEPKEEASLTLGHGRWSNRLHGPEGMKERYESEPRRGSERVQERLNLNLKQKAQAQVQTRAESASPLLQRELLAVRRSERRLSERTALAIESLPSSSSLERPSKSRFRTGTRRLNQNEEKEKSDMFHKRKRKKNITESESEFKSESESFMELDTFVNTLPIQPPQRTRSGRRISTRRDMLSSFHQE